MSAQPGDRHWFITLNGKRYGPYTFAALTEAAAKGVITRETRVWRLGWVNWHPAQNVPGLVDPPGGAAAETEAPNLAVETAEKSTAAQDKDVNAGSEDRRRDERNIRRHIGRELSMRRLRAAIEKKDVKNVSKVQGADVRDAVSVADRSLIREVLEDAPGESNAGEAPSADAPRTARLPSPASMGDRPQLEPDAPDDLADELLTTALANMAKTPPSLEAGEKQPPSEQPPDPNLAPVELRAVRDASAGETATPGEDGVAALPSRVRHQLSTASGPVGRGPIRRLTVPVLVVIILAGTAWGLMASGIVIVVRPPWLDRWVATVSKVLPGAGQLADQSPQSAQPPPAQSARTPPDLPPVENGPPSRSVAPAAAPVAADQPRADMGLPAAIAALPAVVALKRTDPASFAKFVRRFRETTVNTPDDQMMPSARTALRKTVRRQLANAPGEMLAEITETYLGYMQGLQLANPESCVALSDESKGAALTINLQRDYPALFAREMAVLERIANIDPGTAVAAPPTEQVQPYLQSVFTALLKQPVQSELLGRSQLAPSEFQPYCSLVIAFYEAALALPADQRTALLRYLYAAAAETDDDAPAK